MRGRPRLDARSYRSAAQQQLKKFRQGTALAVALTGILLMLGGASAGLQEGGVPAAASPIERATEQVSAAAADAATTMGELAESFYTFLPRLLIALLLVAIAAVVVRIANVLLKRALGAWQRTAAVIAITRLLVFLVAAIAVLTILAGDVRTVVGSVGLLGLAASWALQTPIESFTGWLLNSFRGYYRVGDRISVGEVFGDVYRIDVLTTTVWEAGGQGKPVAAAQSTGALITFPNWEVLRSNIVNYSRKFPYVWDEVGVNVANESDLGYTQHVLEATARRVFGAEMITAAQQYEQLLRAESLWFDVDEVPRVYFSSADSWTTCTIRYVVPVRSRRAWASTLLLEISRELARDEHRRRIRAVYPRHEVMLQRTWSADESSAE